MLLGGGAQAATGTVDAGARHRLPPAATAASTAGLPLLLPRRVLHGLLPPPESLGMLVWPGCRWDVYEGRLAPRQPALRQMSTGLDSPLPDSKDPQLQPAPTAAASARRGLAAAPAAAAERAPGRASSLPTPLPQVPAS